jgi:formylglycine-generating enzyme required for sulfatase activity
LLRTLTFKAILCFTFYAGFTQENSFKIYEFSLPDSNFKIKMMPVPGGSFLMGANNPADPMGKEVTVSDFWMSAYEITHDQFGIFFKDESITQGSKVDAITRPTAQYIDLSWNMGKDGGFPVNSMSQDAALMFCRWLYKKTGIFYRLPTEAEWEYACKAGSKTIYPFGNDAELLDQYAWFEKNSDSKYQKVGLKKPNALGLYDMLGNVAEWTLDQYDEDYLKNLGNKTLNPVIEPSSRYPRSIRGGSYLDEATELAPTNRKHSEADWNIRDPQIPKSRWWLTDGAFVGFRILCPLKQPTAAEAEKFYTLYLGK